MQNIRFTFFPTSLNCCLNATLSQWNGNALIDQEMRAAPATAGTNFSRLGGYSALVHGVYDT
jgi:hypothetical protein